MNQQTLEQALFCTLLLLLILGLCVLGVERWTGKRRKRWPRSQHPSYFRPLKNWPEE